MIRGPKRDILGIFVDAIDYDAAVDSLLDAARRRLGMSATALAVHGLMHAVLNDEYRYRLNHFELVVPDGQPVKWALNWLHKSGLEERVYGPELMARLLHSAASEGLPVYLYGSTADIINRLRSTLPACFLGLQIVGAEPSCFRTLNQHEQQALVERVHTSGARLLFVGLGCPRQEEFAYCMREHLQMPIITVGAAFPFLAGVLKQAPTWMQKRGLEWLFRLLQEPRRLWARYLLLNPAYLFLLTLQRLRFRFDTRGVVPTQTLFHG